MVAALILAAVAVFVILVLHAADWLGREWFILVLVTAALSYVALWTWHRRRIRELESRTADSFARYRRHHRAVSWPRYCTEDGTTVHDWRAMNRHNAHHERLDRLEKLAEAAAGGQLDGIPADSPDPVRHVDATVTMVRPAGPAGIDTMLDDPETPELEA